MSDLESRSRGALAELARVAEREWDVRAAEVMSGREFRSGRQHITRRLLVGMVLVLAVAGLGIGLTLAGTNGGSAPTKTTQPAGTYRTTTTTTLPQGTVSYPAEQVTITAPSGSPPSSQSASSVLEAFKTQPVPMSVLNTVLNTETPDVAFATVTEGSPTSPEVTAGVPFPAWVVTYASSPAVSYGPGTIPKDSRCKFVGIEDSATATWTDFFQSCSPQS